MYALIFCRHCGLQIDQNDVDANLNTWGIFKIVCSDCIELEDTLLDSPER